MTEKIQHIIKDIRLKCNALHVQLISVRREKGELEVELNELKSKQLSIIKEKVALIEDNSRVLFEVHELKSRLQTILDENVNKNSTLLRERDEEIDDLVREIEGCINQLKK